MCGDMHHLSDVRGPCARCSDNVAQDMNGVAARSLAASLLPAYYRPSTGKALTLQVQRHRLMLLQLSLTQPISGDMYRLAQWP